MVVIQVIKCRLNNMHQGIAHLFHIGHNLDIMVPALQFALSNFFKVVRNVFTDLFDILSSV